MRMNHIEKTVENKKAVSLHLTYNNFSSSHQKREGSFSTYPKNNL